MRTATNIDSGSSTSIGVFTTNSIAPPANTLILVSLFEEISPSIGDVPSISGNGISWTQIDQSAIPIQNKCSIWAGSATNPSAGVITFTPNYTPSSAKRLWIVDKITGIDLINAIVQHNINQNSGSSSSISVSLNAFANQNNPTYGVIGRARSGSISAGGGLSQVTQVNQLSCSIMSMFINSNQTTVSASYASDSGDTNIIGMELKAANLGNFLSLL